MDLTNFIEERLKKLAQRIIDGGESRDEVALGEMTFFMALRRVMSGKATPQDIGTMDAINDTLQELGIIDKKTVFFKKS